MPFWRPRRYARRRRTQIVERKSVIVFNPGQTVEILGRPFDIQVTEKITDNSRARLKGSLVSITIPIGLGDREKKKHVSNLARRVIAAALLSDIERIVKELNEAHFKSQINKVRLKDTATMWGSCSMRNNINLDFRLLFAPQRIRDAIIIHELAHTVHRDHSKEFWGLVKGIVPDYKERRKWLRENAPKLNPTVMQRSAPAQQTVQYQNII